MWRRRDRSPARDDRGTLGHIYAADRADLASLSAIGVSIIGFALGYLGVAVFAIGTARHIPVEVLAAAPVPLLLTIDSAAFILALQRVRARSARHLELLMLQGTPHEQTATHLGMGATDHLVASQRPMSVLLGMTGALLSGAMWLSGGAFAIYCLRALPEAGADPRLTATAGALYATTFLAAAVPAIAAVGRIRRQ